jgi:hypothetical protein
MRKDVTGSAAPEKVWRGPRPVRGFPHGVHFPSDYNRAMVVIGKVGLREIRDFESVAVYQARLLNELQWLCKERNKHVPHGETRKT